MHLNGFHFIFNVLDSCREQHDYMAELHFIQGAFAIRNSSQD